MTAQPLTRTGAAYLLNTPQDGARLLHSLDPRLTAERHEAPVEMRLYLDTFDRRLAKADMRLWVQGEGHEQVLGCATPGAPILLQASAGVPQFAADIGAGAVLLAIDAIVQSRRLLPLARVQRNGARYDVLDERRKTVLRVTIVETHASSPALTSDPQALGAVMRTHPVRGYERPLRRMERALAQSGLDALHWDELGAALHALGEAPGPPRFDVELDCKDPAALATRRVLASLLRVVEAQHEGTRGNVDSEFLHELRVTARRIRAVLKHIRGIFSREVSKRFRNDWKWICDETRVARDLDVLDELIQRESARMNVEAELAPLVERLRARRADEQVRVRALLDSPRYAHLIDSFRTLVDDDLSGAGARAAKPIGKVARSDIKRAFKQWRKRYRSFHTRPHPDSQERLRGASKRLRYLIESFASLGDRQTAQRLATDLREIHDGFGDQRDAQIHASALERFATELPALGAPPTTVLTMGRLMERFGALELQRGKLARERARLFSRNAARRLESFWGGE